MTPFPHTFFVTGTDTGVGKTFISAILVAGLQASYWKPIQAGRDPVTDKEWIGKFTGVEQDKLLPESYLLSGAMSPHAAAKFDGVKINLDSIEVPQFHACNHLVVEGAGGVMVPLNDRQFMLDLMVKLQLPVLLVTRSTLGTINHTLLSLDKLKSAGLEVFGVVMNGSPNAVNRHAIEHFANVPVVAAIERQGKISPQILRSLFDTHFGGLHADCHHLPDMAPLHANEDEPGAIEGQPRKGSIPLS